MIALRGHLRRIDSKSTSKKSINQKDPTNAETSISNPPKTKPISSTIINSTSSDSSEELIQWEWVGVWSFQKLTDQDLIKPPLIRQKNSKQAPIQSNRNSQMPRPFRYRFHTKKHADSVLVPKSAQDENDEEEEDLEEEKSLTLEGNSDEKRGDNQKDKVDIDNCNEGLKVVKSDESSTKETETNTKKGNEGTTSSSKKPEKENSKNLNDVKDGYNEETKKSSSTTTESTTKDGITETKSSSETIKSTAEDSTNTKKSEPITPRKQSRKRTFGSHGYTDAGLTQPKQCPIGGSWNGYFENPSPRKDRNISRVNETFYLFFNATPPTNASITFDNSSEKDAKLLPHHIHVRGMGSNPFGTFQIVGGLNLKTSVLHCHRMYIHTPPITTPSPPPSSSSNKKKTDHLTPTRVITRVRSRSMRLEDMDVSGYGLQGLAFASTSFGASSQNTNEARKYHTRKKRMTWQTSKDEKMETTNTSDMNRSQNPNFSSPNSNNILTKKVLEKMGSGGNSKLNRKRARSQSDGVLVSNTSSDSRNLSSPVLSSNFLDTNNISHVSSTPSSSKKLKTPKSSSSSGQSSKKSKSSPPPHVMILPKAGQAKDARWRSAHYIYFQMTETPSKEGGDTSKSNSNTSNSNNSSNNNSNNSTQSNSNSKNSNEPYSFCVYEGEMNKGNQQREGLGICLYPSKNIYQGYFQKNKEHGFGMLLTHDREICIYKGEWERGRMHGKGRYYYQSTGGMYEGEFKENARHGVGRYTLEDGGVYDGEWRENLQSGRGSFTWKDGSMYMGLWKDGKRHGQGMLKTCDGFTYDGMWNANAMEGRGIAEYPNGQRYEGLWSKGKKEGRGTIRFTNGAIYEGRFKEDRMEGQGTMKMNGNVCIRGEIRTDSDTEKKSDIKDGESEDEENLDWMIPIQFQSDMGHIHQKAGFTKRGE